MIDSCMTLNVALGEFRQFIFDNYGENSNTAKHYLNAADSLKNFASENCAPPTTILQRFYEEKVGCPAFEAPPKRSRECYARTVLMVRDLFLGQVPKRKYCYGTIVCPPAYKAMLDRYTALMTLDQKSDGTIRTRSGRITVFFLFLDKVGCKELSHLKREDLLSFMGSLNEKYSSQGRASILYTIRNFFSYTEFLEQIQFDPLPFLTRLHSKKHERLNSFYTTDEIRRVLEAVDRSCASGKATYLMLLFACTYGLRSSDIKNLSLDDINWRQRTISIVQFKTKKPVQLPITEEILFALLDYIKNVRPESSYNNVFIRLRKPHIPYSMNDHFGVKIEKYFKIAGVDTDEKHHGFHSLRHSVATNLLSAEVPVNEIATILGHTSSASTKTYIWSDIEHLRSVALEVPSRD